MGRDEVLGSRDLAAALCKNGQMLAPMLELITAGKAVVDEANDVMGRATIEAVLRISAAQVAGQPHQGRKGTGGITRHGFQAGAVPLSDRTLRVAKPRLRGADREVAVPAYQALRQHPRAGPKMMDTLFKGVSTRHYQGVICEMANTAGASKSAVSREFVQQSEKVLEDLLARRFDDRVIVAIYIDGIILGTSQNKHHILTPLGVDEHGNKLVLGLREGASENGAVVKALLEDLVQRGVKPGLKRLFIIDGSKALRAGIARSTGVSSRCSAAASTRSATCRITFRRTRRGTRRWCCVRRSRWRITRMRWARSGNWPGSWRMHGRAPRGVCSKGSTSCSP